MRAHFGDLIKVASILFGFCLTSLTFFIQSATTWKQDSKIDQLGRLAVELHVWSLATWLGILAYILVLWMWGSLLNSTTFLCYAVHSFLATLFAYGCLQIFSQVLELSVLFHERKILQSEKQTCYEMYEKCRSAQQSEPRMMDNEPMSFGTIGAEATDYLFDKKI
jgi:vacuolar-type H+-ATPase subunit I/STV1